MSHLIISIMAFLMLLIPQATLLAQNVDLHPTVVKQPSEGDEFWHMPSSQKNLGEGALINIKVDRVSVPYTNMVAVTQTLSASGIPVHLHTFEDELIYVVSGQGFAIVGEDRSEVPLEKGSVVYIPIGEWHGVRNTNPKLRMEILLVTTPAEGEGLGSYFRHSATLPGHPPLNVSEKEFMALATKYGMKSPDY